VQQAETDNEMEKMVKSLSRGFARVLKDQSGQMIMQFNHQSIDDSLLLSGFWDLGSPVEVSVRGKAHFQLSRPCIRYITMTEVLHQTTKDIQELRIMLPFLDYAARNWSDHAQIVEAKSISQDDHLDLFAWPSNHVLEHLINKNGRTSFVGMNLLHMASRYGFCITVIAILASLECSILLKSTDE
jgi:hypothetical protein